MPTKKQILVPMLPALPMVDDGISGSTVDGGGDYSSTTRNNNSTSTETDVGISDAIASSSNTTEKKKKKRGWGAKEESNPRKKYKRDTTDSFIDLSDVPHKPPILKNDLSSAGYFDNSRNRPIKNNSSKYTGVYYQGISKWKAQIMVDKSVRSIGYYDTEEAAAIDYARAAFKYKRTKLNNNIYGGLDLSNIPEQQSLITNANSKSGYKGVKKMRDKWQARIVNLNGKYNTLGTFDSALEAAGIYARAARYLEEKLLFIMGKGSTPKRC